MIQRDGALNLAKGTVRRQYREAHEQLRQMLFGKRIIQGGKASKTHPVAEYRTLAIN